MMDIVDTALVTALEAAAEEAQAEVMRLAEAQFDADNFDAANAAYVIAEAKWHGIMDRLDTEKDRGNQIDPDFAYEWARDEAAMHAAWGAENA